MIKNNITTATLNNEYKFLVRYVKPSYIVNGETGDEIFQLREDRSPPEEYISFFHSTKITINEKIDNVKLIFKKNGFRIKKTSGFLFLNAYDALKDINNIKQIISFKEEGYPHYGMYYLSEDIIDIQEAKTILLYNSELHLNKDYDIKSINVTP